MAFHIDFGRQAEVWAAAYLEKEGYTIIEKNWHWGHLEIDIIAIKDARLHFVEVKARSSQSGGHPEGKVDWRKIRFLQSAAAAFLRRTTQFKDFNIDILAITINGDGQPQFFMIPDIYL